MSRTLENILFGAPSPRAKTVTRVVSVVAAAVLLLLAAAVVLRFHSAGQLEPRLWKFFAWPTTWGTLLSATRAKKRFPIFSVKVKACISKNCFPTKIGMT